MVRKINTLLNKKTWRGDELGKLLMSSLIHDVKQVRENKEPTPLFSQSDFEALERSLKTSTDYTAYGIYTDLYASIIDNYNRSQSQYQQFLQGYHRLLHYFTDVQNAENAELSLINQPYIFTEKQYNDLKEIEQKKLDNIKISYIELFFNILEHAINNGENSDKELLEAIAKYEDIPETNKDNIQAYFDIVKPSYSILPNGKRSDKLTPEEWQEEEEKQILDKFKLTINGKPATKEKTLKEYSYNQKIEKASIVFNGVEGIRNKVKEKTGQALDLSDKDIKEAIYSYEHFDRLDTHINPAEQAILDILEYPPVKKQKLYDIEELEITKLDTLEAFIDETNSLKPAKESIEVLQVIKEHYSDLYKLIKDYIEEALPETKKLTKKQLNTPIFTWKELSEVIPLYKRYTTVDYNGIIEAYKETTENWKTYRKGIAIIKDYRPDQVDDKGYYIEPKSPLLYTSTLENIIKDNDTLEAIEDLSTYLIEPSITYLYAFNTLLDILQNVYQIEDLDILKADIDYIKRRTEAYNSSIHFFYMTVRGNGEEEKENKRAIIKTIFTEIKAEEYKPTKKAIDKVTKEIDSLGLSPKAKKQYRYLDKFINALTVDTKGATND